jgi:biotin carboxyl carrier protein
MKSYWIAGAVFIVTAWPCSKARAISAQQPSADGNPQSSAPAANVKNPVQAAVTAKPAAAATATVTPTAAPETVKPKASYMLVELSRTLKAKKLKVGDKVKAEVSQDVVSHGKVIIPVETKLVGHVTEVSARDSAHPESRLGIVFDRILLKHFQDIDFEAVVQAVSQPVVRKSRVDEPSQMLPPSMVGGGISRDAPNTSSGRGASSSTSTRGSGGGAATASLTTYQTPITVKQSPSTHVDASGALLETAATGKPSISIGMPQGVFGLKGLSLSTTPSASTPGPVIVSNTENVKLDSGTQMLLQVLKVQIPADAKPAK